MSLSIRRIDIRGGKRQGRVAVGGDKVPESMAGLVAIRNGGCRRRLLQVRGGEKEEVSGVVIWFGGSGGSGGWIACAGGRRSGPVSRPSELITCT